MLGIGRFGGIAGSFLVAELAARDLSFSQIFHGAGPARPDCHGSADRQADRRSQGRAPGGRTHRFLKFFAVFLKGLTT